MRQFACSEVNYLPENMSNLELDKELIILNHEYKNITVRYSEVEDQINELENESVSLEIKMNTIEKRIEKVTNELLKIKLDKINIFTDDSFVNDFIKASYFAIKEEGTNPTMQHVNITDCEIMATDAYKGIVIRNRNIPEELKNTKIKWDVREDFRSHINAEISKYPRLKTVIEDARKSNCTIFKNVSPESFYSNFLAEVTGKKVSEEHNLTLCFQTDNGLQKSSFNKYYIDISLKCLKGSMFNVYYTGHKGCLLMENKTTSVVIMPLVKNN